MHSPPCSRMAAASLEALASLRVVSTVKKPSWANFCATAPPTPQRTPTSTSLSSTVLPCASKVLGPSDCHFEVAPITTATCLPLEFVLIQKSPFSCCIQVCCPRYIKHHHGEARDPFRRQAPMFYVYMLASKPYG